jgi:hypothetical protein
MAIEWWTNPKHLGTKLDSGTIYNRAGGVLDLSIIQGPFSVAPCQTLISRFATFASLYSTYSAARGRVLILQRVCVAGAHGSPSTPDGFVPMQLHFTPEQLVPSSCSRSRSKPARATRAAASDEPLPPVVRTPTHCL